MIADEQGMGQNPASISWNLDDFLHVYPVRRMELASILDRDRSLHRKGSFTLKQWREFFINSPAGIRKLQKQPGERWLLVNASGSPLGMKRVAGRPEIDTEALGDSAVRLLEAFTDGVLTFTRSPVELPIWGYSVRPGVTSLLLYDDGAGRIRDTRRGYFSKLAEVLNASAPWGEVS